MSFDTFEQLSRIARPSDCGPLWHVYELNCGREVCPEGYVRLTGCDAVGYYKRGPRKGEPKFKGYPNKRSVFVTMDVYRAAIATPTAQKELALI